MNINVERFLALTAMLAAPLVAAPGCIIGSSDDTSTTDTASNTNGGTGTDTGSTGNTSAPTTTQSESTVGDSTIGDTTTEGAETGVDTGVDTTAGETGADLGNCCVADDHGAGCEVTEVNDCVCAEDPICCSESWDMFCVGEVNDFGCGACVLPPQPWDCFCTAACNGTPIDTPFQVCGGDATEAADAGQTACEQSLMDMTCMETTCSDCSCSTAEVPEITC